MSVLLQRRILHAPTKYLNLLWNYRHCDAAWDLWLAAPTMCVLSVPQEFSSRPVLVLGGFPNDLAVGEAVSGPHDQGQSLRRPDLALRGCRSRGEDCARSCGHLCEPARRGVRRRMHDLDP